MLISSKIHFKLCFFGRSKLNYQQWEQTSQQKLAFCSSTDGYIVIGNMSGIIRQFGLFPIRFFSPLKYNIRQSWRNRHFRRKYHTKMHEAESSFIMLNAALNVNTVYIWMWILTEASERCDLAPVDLLSFLWLAFLPGIIYKLIFPVARTLAGLRTE